MPQLTTTANTEELIHDLMRDRAIAHVATLTPDGEPHVTPMWFHYNQGEFWFVSPRNADKVKHIEQDDRIAISISDTELPYRAIMARGKARVIDDGTAKRLTQDLQKKYIGSTDDELSFTEEDENIAIRLSVDHLESWTAAPTRSTSV